MATLTSACPAGCPIIEWARAGVGLDPRESGDLHVVLPFPDGVLVAVIDGLGHGPEAALASRVARDALETHPNEPVADLVRHCHAALRSTRGVVMSLASLDSRASALTWIGVGNVEGILLCSAAKVGARHPGISASGGVVGYRLPSLRSATLPLSLGDTLILATDGIHPGFSEGLDLEQAPHEIADSILEQHYGGSDDALVVVARYVGGLPCAPS
jgi:negative regulator of sigma-B (phosphoserine phosphatase)